MRFSFASAYSRIICMNRIFRIGMANPIGNRTMRLGTNENEEVVDVVPVVIK